MAKHRDSDKAGTASPRWHTVADVADRLKVSQRQVRRWLAEGLLLSHKFGRCVRISRAALDEFERRNG